MDPSKYHMTYEAWLESSASTDELVLPEVEALAAVDEFAHLGITGIAWEGWLVYRDGSLGHSGRHQGTVDFVDPVTCSRTIEMSAKEYRRNPEALQADLYFCLSPDIRQMGERP